MKKRGPIQGRRLALLCVQCLAAFDLHAQTSSVWTHPSSVLGIRQPPTVDAAGPLAAGATSNSLRYNNGVARPVAEPRRVDLGPELDLLKAVKVAVAWQPSVGAAAADLAQRGSAVEVARAGYMPAVQVGVNAGRQSASQTGPAASVIATQMLYDFGKIGSQVSEAEAGVRAAQAEVLNQIDVAATQTALAVIELSRYQALQEIASTQVAALNDVARVTELRAKLGASTRVDPVQARARVQAAQVYGLQLQSQARQWRSRLISLVAAEVPDRVAPLPTESLDAAVSVPAGQQVWPPVLVAEADRQVQVARLDSARAASKPTVSLEGTLSRNLGNTGAGMRNGDHGIYIKLNSAPMQGGMTAAREKGAVQAVQAAEARVEAKRIELKDKLKGLRERIEGLRALRAPLLERQRVITETRSLYREQYLALGTRSALDLLNAEQEIAQAAFDVVQNQHDLLSAQVSYIEANGQAREVYGINNSRVQGLEVLP